MKYRSALKILVIVGILFSFVNGITEYRNQVLALEFSLLLTVIWITEYYLFQEKRDPENLRFQDRSRRIERTRRYGEKSSPRQTE
jgi:hypothetical protein